MLQMKEVQISDKAWVDAVLEGCPHNTLEYNFTTTFIWRSIYNFRIVQNPDWFILFSDTKQPSFLYPYGKGEIKPVLDEMIAYCKNKGNYAGVPQCIAHGARGAGDPLSRAVYVYARA